MRRQSEKTNREKKGCQREAPIETSSGGSGASTRTGSKGHVEVKMDNNKDQDSPSMWSLRAWTRLVWLAGWLARWLKWKTLEARQLQARRDGSFNNGPCS